MGCYMSKPDTKVYLTEGKGPNYLYTSATCQGWRCKQEDSDAVVPDFEDDASLFVLCDGHGGPEVARYTAEHLPNFIKNHPLYKDGNYQEALKRAFIDFDQHLRTDDVMKELSKLSDNKSADSDETPNETSSKKTNQIVRDLKEFAKPKSEDNGQGPSSSGQYPSPQLQGQSSELAPGPSSSSAGPSSSSKPSSSSGPHHSTRETYEEEDDVDISTLKKEAQVPITEILHKYSADSHKVQQSEQPSSSGSSSSRPRTSGDANIQHSSESDQPKPSSSKAADDEPSPSKITAKTIKESILMEVLKQYFPQGEEDSEDDEDDSEFQASDSNSDDDDGDDESDVEETGKSRRRLTKKNRNKDFDPTSSSSEDDSEDYDDEEDDENDEEEDSDQLDEDGEQEKDDNEGREGAIDRASKQKSKLNPSNEGDDANSDGNDDDEENEGPTGSKNHDEAEDDEDDDDDDDDDNDQDEEGEDEEGTDSSDNDLTEEEYMRLMSGQFKLRSMSETIQKPGIDSGCTCVVTLIKDGKVYVANAGDSRCIMITRDGRCVSMTYDHKPELYQEMKRIIRAGGEVKDGRINGGLNLSRALGDFVYKDAELEPHKQMISPVPCIQTQDLTDDIEYIVLACDGIWNSMTNKQVTKFIRKTTSEVDHNLVETSLRLFNKCMASSTDCDGTGCDNMTSILVRFTDATNGKRREAEEEGREAEAGEKRPRQPSSPSDLNEPVPESSDNSDSSSPSKGQANPDSPTKKRCKRDP